MLRSVVSEDTLTVIRRPSAAELSRVTPNERTRSLLVGALVPGTPAAVALVRCVQALVIDDNFVEARSLTRGARGIGRLRDAARAAAAVMAVALGRLDVAEEQLRDMPESALALVPAEVVAVQLTRDRPAAVATSAAVLGTSEELAPETWLELARQTFARGELDVSEQALSRVDADQASAPARMDREARWLARWIARARDDRGARPVPEGQVAVAVLDYKLPDYRRTSANVGDYIQTLASLGHLVRHQGVRFHGEPELTAELDVLRARVPPELRLAGTERDLAVVAVNRDASSVDAVPEGTWMLAFGWYMHPWFRVRYDFPLHPHLRPLFVSFHVNRPQLLSADGISYLRRYAPIGCRDWPTVHRLLEHDVPAFFTGCLTSTVDLLFEAEPRQAAANAPVAFVDVEPAAEAANGRPTTALRHAALEIREASLPANLARAVRTLQSYRRDYSGIVTSRLHCYLPVRSLGVDVRFEPKRENDPRFEGLVGIDDASFQAMRQGLNSKLELVLASILSGDDERTVRATWNDICAPGVEDARRRHRKWRESTRSPQSRSM
jgi:hypothetical protein